MSLGLHLTLNCVVCDQPRDDEAVAEARVEVALFDAIRFGVCPRCNRKVERPFDPEYRRRCREHLAGDRPDDREGFILYARRNSDGEYHWVYKETRRGDAS